jgi:NADPH2:quinone reductase
MRAWHVTAHGEPADVLRLVDVDEPEPLPGHVRVRVEAAAIGLPDVFMCRNTYAFQPPLPAIVGQEVCGVVEAVADGVQLPVGSRIMGVTAFYAGQGGFAECAVLQEATCYRVPDGMSAADAAGFRIGYSTGWVGLVRRGGLQTGETLAVLGAAGGSGVTAVQLGHALGARVIAVGSAGPRLDGCLELGADVLVDRTTEDVTAALLEATDGRGVEAVYDPVGGELAGQALAALATGGRFLAVGFASGDWVQAETPDLVLKNQSLVGVFAGGWSREQDEADHEELLQLWADGRLKPVTTAHPFEALPAAITAVADGSAIGKQVLVL